MKHTAIHSGAFVGKNREEISMIAKLKANKLLALLLCLVMVMGLLPTMALADETVGKVDEAPTESEVETGGLKIELFVTGAGADESKEFEISVSLKDSDGAAVSGTFGDYTFIDGVTTVYLSHLNSVVFTGIPGGTISTVTPTDVDNYTVEAHGSGLIRKNTTGIILVAVDYIGPIEVETGSLTVSKTVSGSVDDRYKAFPFTVYVYNGDSPLEGTYGDMVFDEEGKATFTLTDGQSVKATGLPVGYSYYVEETDNKGYTVTAKVNGEPYNFGEESGVEGVIESDNLDVVVAFNNNRFALEETTTPTPSATPDVPEETAAPTPSATPDVPEETTTPVPSAAPTPSATPDNSLVDVPKTGDEGDMGLGIALILAFLSLSSMAALTFDRKRSTARRSR